MTYIPNPNPTAQPDWIAQLEAEGRLFGPGATGGVPSGFSTNTPPTVTAGSAIFKSSNTVPLGRRYVLLGVGSGVNQTAGILWDIVSSSRTNAYPTSYSGYNGVGSSGGPHSFDFFGRLEVPELCTIDAGHVNPTTTGAFQFGSARVIDITGDPNWGAKRHILQIGDSIAWTIPGTNGTAGAYGEDLFNFYIRMRLNARGYAGGVRLINKAFGGSTMLQGQVAIDEGYYHLGNIKPDLILIHYGMNDAALMPSGYITSFTAAMQAFVNWRNWYCPGVEIIFIAPPTSTDFQRLYGTGVRINTPQAVGTNTVTLDSGASSTDGFYATGTYALEIISATTGAGQNSIITGYVGSTKVATLQNSFATAVTGATEYGIFDTTISPTSIAQIRSAISSFVSSSGDPTLYFVDFSQLYNASQMGTYSGDGFVHMNIAAHALAGPYLGNTVATTKFYRNGGLSGAWT